MREQLRFDSPIHNLQVFLRTISKKHSEIPMVIPDGVYGEKTAEAVSEFQKLFGLGINGISDNDTWDSIIKVYKEIEEELSEPNCVRIYPEHGLRYDTGSYTPTVYIMQIMMLALSERFDNIPPPSLNGVLDYETIESIKGVQRSCALNPDGNITKIFWNYLAAIYETFVSNDRVSVSNIT